jgi:hypothetical protein
MVCSACRQTTPDDHDFCRNCGAYLRWDEADPATAVTAPLGVRSAQVTPASADEPPRRASPDTPTTVMGLDAAPAREDVRLTLAHPGGGGTPGEDPILRVDAGGSGALTGRLFNQSGIVDAFELQVEGLDPAWWTITPPTLHLVPFGAEGGSHEQGFDVRVHPPQAPEAEARAWPVRLVARSRSRGSEARAAATVVIAPFERFELRLRPQSARDRRAARFVVPVRNLGNAPLAVRVAAEDDEGRLGLRVDPPELRLDRGADGAATIDVTAPEDVRGAERHHRLTVTVESGRQRLQSTGAFIQEPAPEPRSRRGWWRVLATVLAAALLLGAAFADWTSAGDEGLCLGGATGCLSYDRYLELNQVVDVRPGHLDVPDGLQGLFDVATSLGVLALLLGLLALAGARSGTLTWLAGVLAVLLAIAVGVTLGDFSGAGVWMLLLGGILAIVAGALARAPAR